MEAPEASKALLQSASKTAPKTSPRRFQNGWTGRPRKLRRPVHANLKPTKRYETAPRRSEAV